jgi:predicted nucleic acid-binding protein
VTERLTYDTNVVIRHSLDLLPEPMYLSAIVVQELTAGAPDKDEVERLRRFGARYDASGRLLVPTGEDWWMAGKILWALRNGVRSRRHGRFSAISKEEQQRITRDVLIARTAKRANVAVVTENVRDFKKISRFCDVKIVRASDYF